MQPNFMSLALAACCLVLASSAPAQDAAKPNATKGASLNDAAAVKAQLEMKFPGATISNVAKSPYFGLYEAQLDDRMVYTDAKATFVFVGSIYDANTKQNLSEARLRQLNRVAWESLPLDLAFKRVKGNGTRKLAIFSDADCPYCKRLESEIKQLDDVTDLHLPFSDRSVASGRCAQIDVDLVCARPSRGVGRIFRQRKVTR